MKFKFTEIGLVTISTFTVTNTAHAANRIGALAGNTFVSGPGAPIFQILLIAIVAWLAQYLSQAIGKGQMGQLINIAAVMGCAMIISNQAWAFLMKILNFAGM